VNVLLAIFILAVMGIVGDTIVKVVRARSGAGAAKGLRGEIDDLNQQLQDQSAALADAQAIIAAQAESIQELHERVDFAERILTQVREKGMLGRGSGEA
jgi:type IV secretory pathway VirB4 component